MRIFRVLSALFVFALSLAGFNEARADWPPLENYGSLDGALDEKQFKPALEAWIKSGHDFEQQFKGLTPQKADALILKTETFRNFQDSGSLRNLNIIVRPVLEKWERGGETGLTDGQKKVLELLRQYGLTPVITEGHPFLVVDEAFFERLLAPRLSQDAESYLAIKSKQPQYFFSDGGCPYGLGGMGAWAVAWEEFLGGRPGGVYEKAAGERYQLIMDFLFFSELVNTPAFEKSQGGQMSDYWRDGLRAVAAGHPRSRTAFLISEYLKAIEAAGWTLTPAIKKTYTDKIKAGPQSWATEADGVIAAAASFYTLYLKRLDAPEPVELTDFLRHRPEVDEALVKKIETLIEEVKDDEFGGLSYDPILMAQEIPLAMQYDRPVITNEAAELIAYERWDDQNKSPLCLSLVKKDGRWRLKDIVDLNDGEARDCGGKQPETSAGGDG